MKTHPPCVRSRSAAFTMVELLVSTTILVVLMLILVGITDATQKTWRYTTGKIDQFREARSGFEAITRRLSQATLNTYLDYINAAGDARTEANSANFIPNRYTRQSDLRFISGDANSLGLTDKNPTHAVFFQAPFGFVSDSTTYGNLENLLNTWGYFIEFGDDSATRPPFITPTIAPLRHRFRLMEFMEPTENFSVYQQELGKTTYTGREWFQTSLGATPRPAHVIAENVIALILLPKLAPLDEKQLPAGTTLAPDYAYDSTVANATAAINSKNQLPPIVQVTMVAVDELSFARMQGNSKDAPNLGLEKLFKTVGDTSDPENKGYAQDLKTLQDTLQSKKIAYRVFNTEVSLKAAKWSREQKN